MTQALVPASHETLALSPTEFSIMVAAAHEKAKTLADVVENAHLYANINGKKYLTVEAWQTIGRAYGYTAKAGEVQLVYDSAGNEIGVKAQSIIYDANGQIVGGADGYCMKDEPTWAGRPFYARAGMAQTRSISRGFRQLVSWVVVLAGYAPTPAEEMTGDEKPLHEGGVVEDRGHGICPEHNVAWFKTEKMRSPAHPKDGGGWCNKPSEKTAQPTPPESPSESKSLVLDKLAPLDVAQRNALRELGYKTLGEITRTLGAPSVSEWLAADQARTPADAMRILREAKNKPQ